MKYFIALFLFVCSNFLWLDFANANSSRAFEHVLQLAQEKSPDLQIKKQNLEQKSYSRWTNFASWLPRADLQISDNRTNANIYTGVIGPESSYKQQALVLSMPLYKRSVQLGVEQSFAEYKQAKFEYQSASQELNYKVKQLLGQVLIAEYKLASIQKSLEVAQRTAKETKIRFDGGSRSQIDVLKTQAQLTNLESQSLSAENDFQKSLDDLRERTGLTKEEIAEAGFQSKKDEFNESTLEASIIELTQFKSEPISKTEIMNEFDSKSRARRTALLNFEIADIKSSSYFAKEWPDLSLKATYQRIAPEWSGLNDSGTESRNIGLTLTIPLFNFGSGISSYHESKALSTVARLQLDQSLKSAANQLEQLADQTFVLKKLVQAQELRKKQLVEIEKLTSKSYELGKSTVQDLLSAQNDSISAKVDYAKARLDYSVALLQLEWTLGSEIE